MIDHALGILQTFCIVLGSGAFILAYKIREIGVTKEPIVFIIYKSQRADVACVYYYYYYYYYCM